MVLLLWKSHGLRHALGVVLNPELQDLNPTEGGEALEQLKGALHVTAEHERVRG